ncbi:hypothetical protein ACQP26_19725 [Micromonospora sp. CA-248089]|uniref:hypothetical protein n=1 Tax=Micromonospora sp. CA-248089 TaxID=3239960 RepID=UPI003D9478DD
MAVVLEAFVTWLSGCPHKGQQPLVRRSKLAYTVEAFGGFFLTIGLGHWAVISGSWYLLPALWLILAGRTWALFNIFHHATHDTLFASQRVNRALAFCSSLLSFSSSLDSYRKEHIQSHHTRKMCTYDDEEAAFMPLGFPPGMPKSYYYRRLTWLVCTPWTYLLYARYRLWDWQQGEPLWRRAAVWTYTVGLVVGAYQLSLMESLLLAYVVPLFVVFNVTGLLGTFSEHHWGTLLDQPARLRLVLLQQSRFLLDPAPDRSLPTDRRTKAWAVWWLRLLAYHLPVRVAVLPGDSMHHDHHHRHPRTEQWTMSTYERFDHLENGCPGFANYPHSHAWTLGEAIDRVFTRMSAAPAPGPELLPHGQRVGRRLFRFAAASPAATLQAAQQSAPPDATRRPAY